jgi:hypothetical protein
LRCEDLVVLLDSDAELPLDVLVAPPFSISGARIRVAALVGNAISGVTGLAP